MLNIQLSPSQLKYIREAEPEDIEKVFEKLVKVGKLTEYQEQDWVDFCNFQRLDLIERLLKEFGNG